MVPFLLLFVLQAFPRPVKMLSGRAGFCDGLVLFFRSLPLVSGTAILLAFAALTLLMSSTKTLLNAFFKHVIVPDSPLSDQLDSAERAVWAGTALIFIIAIMSVTLSVFGTGFLSDQLCGLCSGSRHSIITKIHAFFSKFFPIVQGLLIVIVFLFSGLAVFILIVGCFADIARRSFATACETMHPVTDLYCVELKQFSGYYRNVNCGPDFDAFCDTFQNLKGTNAQFITGAVFLLLSVLLLLSSGPANYVRFRYKFQSGGAYSQVASSYRARPLEVDVEVPGFEGKGARELTADDVRKKVEALAQSSEASGRLKKKVGKKVKK